MSVGFLKIHHLHQRPLDVRTKWVLLERNPPDLIEVHDNKGHIHGCLQLVILNPRGILLLPTSDQFSELHQIRAMLRGSTSLLNLLAEAL